MDQPPYMHIADHYRRQIIDGELVPGAQLPTVKQLAEKHGVATATAAKALSQLQVEGCVYTSPRRGSFVADTAYAASSPRDRLDRLQRTGSILGVGETTRVTAAELLVPPLYVQELYGLDDGDQVVRREWVTGRGNTRLALTVTWHPAQFAVHVPDLLSAAPSSPSRMIDRILQVTGRAITHARDDFHAREADEREADLLGVKLQSTVLGYAYRWSDDLGIIEYGEVVLPRMHTIGYEYTPAL